VLTMMSSWRALATVTQRDQSWGYKNIYPLVIPLLFLPPPPSCFGSAQILAATTIRRLVCCCKDCRVCGLACCLTVSVHRYSRVAIHHAAVSTAKPKRRLLRRRAADSSKASRAVAQPKGKLACVCENMREMDWNSWIYMIH
jgi:hypothetical protein